MSCQQDSLNPHCLFGIKMLLYVMLRKQRMYVTDLFYIVQVKMRGEKVKYFTM